mmetsp:Transcript_15216/g.45600  ORF Transcript_15216/g.45600 Transcript_15216/m.45600 type:complete len:223 (+) Transcript_15216:3594-4262(+)
MIVVHRNRFGAFALVLDFEHASAEGKVRSDQLPTLLLSKRVVGRTDCGQGESSQTDRQTHLHRQSIELRETSGMRSGSVLQTEGLQLNQAPLDPHCLALGASSRLADAPPQLVPVVGMHRPVVAAYGTHQLERRGGLAYLGRADAQLLHTVSVIRGVGFCAVLGRGAVPGCFFRIGERWKPKHTPRVTGQRRTHLGGRGQIHRTILSGHTLVRCLEEGGHDG